MYVPSYQMHNVLNGYSQRLSQNRIRPEPRAAIDKLPGQPTGLSNQGKRQVTMEKVANEILARITGAGSRGKSNRRGLVLPAARAHTNGVADGEDGKKFRFNIIDDFNNKKTRTLSVEDTGFVIDRLEQLAKAVVGKPE